MIRSGVKRDNAGNKITKKPTPSGWLFHLPFNSLRPDILERAMGIENVDRSTFDLIMVCGFKKYHFKSLS
ncbi:hypothetical protein KSF73_01380 [Burkholderiaceae bacterium DAT-1]|nr:hypothetical protein [Burkholderiaceae bacterium DAT-1]